MHDGAKQVVDISQVVYLIPFSYFQMAGKRWDLAPEAAAYLGHVKVEVFAVIQILLYLYLFYFLNFNMFIYFNFNLVLFMFIYIYKSFPYFANGCEADWLIAIETTH